MEDITRKPPLRLSSLALRNLRLLLCAVCDFELRVKQIHPAFRLPVVISDVHGGSRQDKRTNSLL